MSKSNPETCIDPLDMIEKYGADALRLSLVIGGSPGNDMRLYEEKIAGYRNFVNKIWNAARFAISNVDDKDIKREFKIEYAKTIGDKWILTELQKLISEATADIENQRFSDAGSKIYDFTWSKYCDWYLEYSKGENKNADVLLYVLRAILKLLHPFVPFVTEKIWESITQGKLLILEEWPKQDKEHTFKKESKAFIQIQKIITEIRSTRAELKVEPAKKITAYIWTKESEINLKDNESTLCKLGRLEKVIYQTKAEKIDKSRMIFIDDIEVQLPISELIDMEKEKAKISKEIQAQKEQIENIQSKLNNKGFTEKAPKELIQKEETRLKETLLSIKKLEAQLEELS